MRRAVYSLAFWLALFPALAGAQDAMMIGAGSPSKVAAVAGFIGPGDVVSGAYASYSCSRGYNTADTADACDVCLPSAGACFHITLTNGFAVVPAGLSTCNITTVICTVKTMFDKTGNSRDVTQATEAKRPTFRPAMASNGCPTTALPCVLFTAASAQELVSSATTTIAQPISVSFVYIRGSSSGEIANNAIDIITQSGAIVLFAGSASSSVTSADGSWHAVQSVFNSSSSSVYVDGSATGGLNPGVAGSTGNAIAIGKVFLTGSYDGFLTEVLFYPSDLTNIGGIDKRPALNSNQHGANGYNF